MEQSPAIDPVLQQRMTTGPQADPARQSHTVAGPQADSARKSQTVAGPQSDSEADPERVSADPPAVHRLREALLVRRAEGLYCPLGGFFVDPWQRVDRAVITHGHADHARPGHAHYLTEHDGVAILKARLGANLSIQGLAYGETVQMGDVELSLHPAGHILGAAQVRIAHRGEVWVISGDYRTEADPSCAAFEPVRCEVFISESTFGLPIYQWEPQESVIAQIVDWWQHNAARGTCSVLYTYALGKAQRLAMALPDGPILVHPAVDQMHRCYRLAGRPVPEAAIWDAQARVPRGALILAPPASADSRQMARLGDREDAFVSGWMQLRGLRRRRALDRGFALSDHADWPGLLQAIGASGAQRVMVTHGQVPVMVRHLRTLGLDASALDAEGWGDEAS